MESKYITNKEILRPPQYGIPASPVTTSPPPSPQPDVVNEEGDESLTHKVLEQEEEIKELKSEVKKLRQCIKGVHVIGKLITFFLYCISPHSSCYMCSDYADLHYSICVVLMSENC